MANSTWAQGVCVKYKHVIGEIAFISEDYLTVCILRRTQDMVSDVCMVVHKENWEDIELLKSSHNRINEQ